MSVRAESIRYPKSGFPVRISSMRGLALLLVSVSATALAQEPIHGFTPESSRVQRELETKLDALTHRANLKDWMRRMSLKPHHVGSTYGKDNAEFARMLFQSWGYEARIETFDVLLPIPKTRSLSLTAPTRFEAKLWEPEVAGDASSKLVEELLPPYNAYSPDGDVSAEVVYVNYGMPADYKVLASKGIDAKGKIVLARYGGGWRGLKPKLAAEKGAIGCLIYSDPRDDGYFQGDTYPKGGFRPDTGVQRGSIADMPIHPGDPLTPFEPSIPGTRRLSLKESKTICPIPTLPISYGDALPILSNLGGPIVPEAWRGALPLAYHFGPGPATVRLKLEFDWRTVECRNVIAVLKGRERPDEWVIRGNHHDAWVFGAEDPISGAVALMEEARCVGELAKQGNRPKRTLVYCLWDGEEPGLLGSTEWVEEHRTELMAKAVVYLNTDSTGRGFLGMGGSHTLEPMLNQAADEVRDPETGLSVLERLRRKSAADGNREARTKKELPIGALGSGSDFTPFLQHAGIASLNLGFGGEGGGGQYHSTYDSYDHYVRFEDTDFAYGETLARLCGRVMLRLANADVLPFDPSRTARYVGEYLAEVQQLAETMRSETEERNRMLADGTLKAALDPREKNVLPEPESPVPFLNFAALQNAATRLREAANAFTKDASARASGPESSRRRYEQALMAFDRAMLDPAGLPGRPWFRHFLYAPGLKTGYGVKTLPGIREAVEERQWRAFDEQAAGLARVLEAMAKALEGAA